MEDRGGDFGRGAVSLRVRGACFTTLTRLCHTLPPTHCPMSHERTLVGWASVPFQQRSGEQQSVATAQVARGWASSLTLQTLEDAILLLLGLFEVAAFQP